MDQKKLTQAERERIYLMKRAGHTIPDIAQALRVSPTCTRKWWRRVRDLGMVGLLERKRGRPTLGALSQFSSEVQQVCLKLKRDHKRWGANRILIELQNDPLLTGLAFPSRCRMYAFFHQAYPDCLSLWTKHNFIHSHRPTDQPQVARCHRTMNGLTYDECSRQDLISFQQCLDQERCLYNDQFSSRASDCGDLPPLQAHPELLRPRRPYRVEQEGVLFDMQRLYRYLAGFILERKVNRNGQVTLKGHHYTVGLPHKEKQILVCLDQQTQEWMFLERDQQGQEYELGRRPLFGLDFFSLIGLEGTICCDHLPPIQLALPLAA